MKLTELLQGDRPRLSFEVFPPKTDTAFESVRLATEEIAALHPAFMSVTYGAGGGVSRYTLDIALHIRERYHVPTLAHLTCVSSTRETVQARIREMRAAGVENVMALRGDLPAELVNADRSRWHYRHAVDLVRELRESGADFCIGGACYPEVHPESSNQREDIRYLKEKVEAGCSFLTTQMFFDNNLLYNFLYKIREAGITVPVIPGIMPITNGNQVARAIVYAAALQKPCRPFRERSGGHDAGGHRLCDGSDHRPVCQWDLPGPCLFDEQTGRGGADPRKSVRDSFADVRRRGGFL